MRRLRQMTAEEVSAALGHADFVEFDHARLGGIWSCYMRRAATGEDWLCPLKGDCPWVRSVDELLAAFERLGWFPLVEPQS